ncbi:MAG: autotransporter-associated beta strand repeat-containing protein, partial [Luteolibacter sp.]
ALPTSSALTLNSGILGLEAGNFTRSLGTAPGQVALTASNGGFAAFGADRMVNLGGAGAQVTWGSGGFFNAGSNLTLGHASATHTVDFQNPINIVGINREINVPDGLAAVDAIISGAITNSGTNTHVQKNGNGTLMLAGVNAWGNELRILAGRVMLGGNTGMVIADTANVQLGAGGTGTGLIFDLNGRSETIGTLNLGGQNTTTAPGVGGNQHAVVNSGASAVLTINGLTYFAAADPLASQNGQATVSADVNTGMGNKNFNIHNSVHNTGTGPLAEEVIISGALTGTSITKLLTGTLVLTNPQYTGNTTVSAGTLVVRKAGTQPNANPNNDASTITIATGAVLNLDYTGTDTVASLVIGANPPITSGVYGSAEFPGIITGSGKLTVGTDAFLAWASNNTGVLFDGDENNDGVKNGLAWLLGAANPTANVNGPLPLITQTGSGLKMTFSMLPASARAGARLFVEHSGDVGTNDPWSAGTLVPDGSGGTEPVTFMVTDSNLVDPNNKLDVEATISASEASANKLFGRLRAEK